MTKKILVLLGAALFALGLGACNKAEDASEVPAAPATEAPAAAADEPAAAAADEPAPEPAAPAEGAAP